MFFADADAADVVADVLDPVVVAGAAVDAIEPATVILVVGLIVVQALVFVLVASED